MKGELILISIMALPLVLGLVMRVATSHIFFSLMAGELLGRYFGHDLDVFAKSLGDAKVLAGYGEAILVFSTMLLTAFFMKGTMSRGKSIIQIIPLIITGIICIAFVLPTLPAGTQNLVRTVPLGDLLLDINRIIVGAMITLQLFALWFFGISEGGHSKEK